MVHLSYTAVLCPPLLASSILRNTPGPVTDLTGATHGSVSYKRRAGGIAPASLNTFCVLFYPLPSQKKFFSRNTFTRSPTMNLNKSGCISRPIVVENSNRDDNLRGADDEHSSSPLSVSFDYHKRMVADVDGHPRKSSHEPLGRRRKDHDKPSSFSTGCVPTSESHQICDSAFFHSASPCSAIGKTATQMVLRARGAFFAALYRVLSTVLSMSIVILIMLAHFSVVTLALVRSHFKCRVSQNSRNARKARSSPSNGVDPHGERPISKSVHGGGSCRSYLLSPRAVKVRW